MKFEMILIGFLVFFSINSLDGQQNLTIQDPNNFPEDATVRQIQTREALSIFSSGPILKDSSLTVEKFVTDLNWPTTMAFVGNDLLVLEKNTGHVRLVRNGELTEEPVLKVNVAVIREQGLLGIATKNSFVYLYYTEVDPETKKALGNRIYKYLWDGNKLIEPVLVKDLLVGKSGEHNAGVMTIGNDGSVYAVIGDVGKNGILQNFPTGEPDDTSVIFPIDPPGPYYSIGIRNSFGLAVDHLTGNIWDTENGRNSFDEINFVLPKSNSGWEKIMGPATHAQIKSLPLFEGYEYSDPEFSWELPVAPTGISFIQSELFKEKRNSVLVGDFHNGILYEFRLNENRTGFTFKDPSLKDLVANPGDSINEVIFGKGFGGITDIEMGPDGLIYVVSIVNGAIYRIIPSVQYSADTIYPNCKKNLGPLGNFSGCNFSGFNLKNVDLSFANLSNTNLSGTNLHSAILFGSDLTGADLTGADLSMADLRYTNLSKKDLKNTNLNGANLRGASLIETNLANSDLSNSKLQDTNLSFANLKDAKLVNVDLRKSILNNANLEKTNLTKANLLETKLIDADLKNADLRGAKIESANFTGSDLSGTNFLGLYPKWTDFTDATFSQETKTDSCIEDNFFSRNLNKVLLSLREIDFILFEPFDWLIVLICSPS